MKKFKTTLLILSISLLSFSGFGQTQEFTDEASFLAALQGNAPSFENYEGATSCNESAFVDLVDFDVSATGDLFYCNSNFFTSDGVGNLFFGGRPGAASSMTITFDSEKNAFGTDFTQAGDVMGPITITLMTDNGDSYTALMAPGGGPSSSIEFYGLITDMLFTSVVITRDNVEDGVGLDRTYCALVPEALIPIPTLSQWGIITLGMLTMIFGVVMIRQRKTIFA